MITRHRTITVARVVAVGLFLVGIAVAGSGLYAEYQSTPYLVQIDTVSPSDSLSGVAYGELSTTQKDTFDRLLTGQVTPVEDLTLEFFSNNAVQYRAIPTISRYSMIQLRSWCWIS